jgi:hypothetical protein
MTVVEDFPSDMQSVICNEQRFMKPTKASPLDYQCNQWCNVPDCVKDKVACSQSLKICAMLNGCAMYVLYMTRARRQALLDTRHIGRRQMSFATSYPLESLRSRSSAQFYYSVLPNLIMSSFRLWLHILIRNLLALLLCRIVSTL